MELDLTAVKTAFAQFSGEAADETGTQREALCAALCGQCARQVASLVRGDLSQAAQALWEAPLEELAAVLFQNRRPVAGVDHIDKLVVKKLLHLLLGVAEHLIKALAGAQDGHLRVV